MPETVPLTMPRYFFDQAEAKRAYDEWGSNCGPAALATCCGMTMDAVRPKLAAVDFERKRYMSPTMMRQAVSACGFRIPREYRSRVVSEPMQLCVHGLVRVQWHGPWTAPGANPRWAYGHTHWIHVKRWPNNADDAESWIFDVNGGWLVNHKWDADIAPVLAARVPRRDGTWSFTHSWEIRRA